MNLQKIGSIFRKEHFAHFSSHAQVPTPYIMNDRVRFYFAARNGRGKSFVTFADFSKDESFQLLYTNQSPVMEFGAPGTFDEDGAMPSQIIRQESEIWLYYTGWNQKVSTPYQNAIGLSKSNSEGISFVRQFEGPIMDRQFNEPFIVVTPFVEKRTHDFYMAYASGDQWICINEKYEPIYTIKQATSPDGIHWSRDGKKAFASSIQHEANVRPTIIKLHNNWFMLFCYRSSINFRGGNGSYKIGLATSTDSQRWERNDEQLHIIGGSEAWENEMQCYPFFFQMNDQTYLVYNGNGFGQSGFGIMKVI